jgi:hypothetical protein
LIVQVTTVNGIKIEKTGRVYLNLRMVIVGRDYGVMVSHQKVVGHEINSK